MYEDLQFFWRTSCLLELHVTRVGVLFVIFNFLSPVKVVKATLLAKETQLKNSGMPQVKNVTQLASKNMIRLAESGIFLKVEEI